MRPTVLQGERNRQHNWEHLKDNGQQTPTKEVQIENTIETVIDDVKGPVKTNKCNKKHKCDYQIYKANLATEKVQTPRGSSDHRTRSLRTAGYRGDISLFCFALL